MISGGSRFRAERKKVAAADRILWPRARYAYRFATIMQVIREDRVRGSSSHKSIYDASSKGEDGAICESRRVFASFFRAERGERCGVFFQLSEIAREIMKTDIFSTLDSVSG